MAAVAFDLSSARSLLDGWRAFQSGSTAFDAETARKLLEGFRGLQHPAPLKQALPVNIAAIRRLLDGMSGPLTKARQSGAFINPWAVAGLGRREVPNAAVLAWMLDPRQSHGQGAACLLALLEKVRQQAPVWAFQPDHLRACRVEAEHRPLGSDRDRVDIVVEGPDLLIFVEVKIDAGEGEAQISRYAESAQKVAAVRAATGLPPVRPLVIFLSPRAPSESVADLVHLTWRDVSAALSEVAASAEGHASFLISTFARHVRSFR